MKIALKNLNVQENLMKWAEVTALSIRLIEASLHQEFPTLSSELLRQKLIERLHVFRAAKLT